MLSICIPVYNYDSRELIDELNKQCIALKIEFEIICIDDASSNIELKKNNEDYLNENSSGNIQYFALSENIGRSAIRNLLVTKCKFEYCWFLDCDGKIDKNENLVKTYLDFIHPKAVISGGRVYVKEIPQNESLRLHWTWASTRELLDVNKRMQQPVQHFLSNNFIAPKKLLQQIPFNEELSGYGYEDTFWASEIVKIGFEIQHINNPVLHDGLEINSVFLNKIDESVFNLIRLKNYCSKNNIEFPIKSKLTKLAEILHLPIIKKVAGYYFSIKKASWKQKLLSNHFNLFIFDLYRLAIYFETIKK